ncbi:MAG: hypothetical protein QOE33_2684 [Acidobacteriota bacterium]|nr:hypothetical protein [Acidobacteriota bacterium]
MMLFLLGEKIIHGREIKKTGKIRSLKSLLKVPVFDSHSPHKRLSLSVQCQS